MFQYIRCIMFLQSGLIILSGGWSHSAIYIYLYSLQRNNIRSKYYSTSFSSFQVFSSLQKNLNIACVYFHPDYNFFFFFFNYSLAPKAATPVKLCVFLCREILAARLGLLQLPRNTRQSYKSRPSYVFTSISFQILPCSLYRHTRGRCNRNRFCTLRSALYVKLERV